MVAIAVGVSLGSVVSTDIGLAGRASAVPVQSSKALTAPSPAIAAESSRTAASLRSIQEADRRQADKRGSGNPYRVRELTGKRSESSSSYLMSDGTTQMVLSTSPVHYRSSAKGKWQPIETEIEAGTGATAFVNETNVFETRFGESRHSLASLAGDGWSVGLGAAGEDRKLTPKANGSKVTVTDVFDSADLDYSVGAGVLKEEIVLPNAKAAPPEGFTFTLDTKGLVAKSLASGSEGSGKAEGGAIGLFTSEKAKRPRLVMPAPFMTDGSKKRSEAVSQVLDRTADGVTTVTITPDADWLGAKDRRFPVRVDPTIVYAPDAADGKDAAIYSGDTAARPADPTIPIGVANGGVWRGLFQFDTSAIPAGSTVYGAQLRLYMSSPHTNQGSPVKMNAYPIVKSWEETTATWANMGTDGHDETPPRVSEPLHYNWFTVDDGDAGATSFTGPWKEISDPETWGRSYSSPTSGTTPDTFDWNAKLPWSGWFDVDARVPPRTGQGSPTYQVTGDQLPAVSTTVNQTTGGLYKSLSRNQHFSPGATAQVRLTRQSGSGAPATTPMADAIRWMEYATATKGATQYDAWHSYGLGSMVQKWIDSPAENFGVLVKAENEDRATAPLGGPQYHSSDATFASEGDTRPQLVVVLGTPGPTQDVPTTVHADGPELSWSQANDITYSENDDVVEYQIFRGCVSLPQAACTTPVGEDFTTEYARNGALKLVGTVPVDTTTFRDDTAVASTATEKATYRYWVVARSVADLRAPSEGGAAEEGRDGTAAAAPQTVDIPREGRIARIFTATRAGGPGGDLADTTLSAAKPTTNLPNPDEITKGDRTWVQAGNNHWNYGDERAVFGFDTSTIKRGVKVTSASFELWKSSGQGTASTYDLHELTRGFIEDEATWEKASTAGAWSTPGGDYKATAVASASLNNDPDRVVFDTTGLKSTVQGWIDGAAGAPNGLLLKIRDEGPSTHRVWFLNSEGAELSLRPRLRVEHLVKNDDQVFEAPTMPERFVPGTITRVPVTVTNTTDTTWPSTLELTYRWTLPNLDEDQTDEGDRLEVALGRALEPGESVEVTLPVRTPIQSDTGSKRLAYDFYLDLRNTTDGAWWSTAHEYKPGGTENSTPGCAMATNGLLCQDRYVENPTSNVLGLEKFGTYTGEEAGAGSQILTNLSSGNVTWSYEPMSNPSVGPSAFVRVAYNSMDVSDAGAGWGVSVQPATLLRLGSRLSVPSGGSTNNLMTFVDGDGTTHVYKLDDDAGTPNRLEYDRPAGIALELHRDTTADTAHQWVFTRADGTRFFVSQETGLQTSVVDTFGNDLTFTYNAQNRLTSVTDSLNRTVLTLNWDTDGLTSITDIAGQRLGFSYSDSHQLTGLSDTAAPVEGVPTAPVKRFGFAYSATSTNGNALLTSVTDPRNNTSQIDYYTSTENSAYANWPQTFTDRRSKTTGFTYSDPDSSEGKDTVAVVTDHNATAGGPGNTVTTYRSDGYGRTTQITDSLQQITKLGWDRDHNVIRLEEANGAVSTWEYDLLTGYPTKVRDAEAVKNGRAATRLHYQELPNAPGAPTILTEKISPAGRTWKFTHDPATAALKTVTNPLQHTTSYAYNPDGTLATVTDAKNQVTTYNAYDESGMPLTVTDALGKVSRFTYDKRGNTLTATDPLTNKSTVAYDGFGRPTAVTTPGDDSGDGSPTSRRTTATEYDLNDNTTTTTAPNGAVTRTTHNATDLPTRVELPDNNTTGRATEAKYDDLGQVIEETAPVGVATTTNPDDFVTRYTYDKVGQQVRVQVPFADTDGTNKTATTRFSYDNVGNLVETIDPVKNATPIDSDYTTKVGYDLNHRPISITDAKGYVTRTEYDPDGLVTATIDPRGIRVRKVYDNAGQLIETHVPHTPYGASSARDQVTKTTYDPLGQVTKTTSPTGRVAETVYDALGRVVQTKAPHKAGNSTYPTPASTFYEYDAASRLIKQSLPTFASEKPAAANQWTSYEHYPSGEIKKSIDPFQLTTTYAYNELGQQIQRSFSSVGNAGEDATTRTQTNTYHPDGSLKSRSEGGSRALIQNYDNAHGWITDSTGTWGTVNSGTNTYGANYRTHAAAAAGSAGASDTFTWKVTPEATDTYQVRASCPVRTDTSTAAKYTINHAGGTSTATANQRTCTAGQKWLSLGSYQFTGATTKTIVLKPSTDGVVVADNIQLVPTAPAPSKDYTYAYDRNGLTTRVDDKTPGAKTNAYETTYDGLGRAAVSRELAGTTERRSTAYTYDLNSNLTSSNATRPADTDQTVGNIAASRYTAYTYDVRDMVATVRTGKDAAEANSPTNLGYTYEYDSRGLPTSLTKPNGNRVGYSFYEDRLLRTTDERRNDAGGKQIVAAHTVDYDADGQKTYDLAKLDQPGSTGTLDQRSTFGYTPGGQVASVTKTGADNGENETYKYDAAGNIIEQVIGATTTTLTYDRNRLITATTGSATATSRYDVYGRMVSVDQSNTVLERYAYDGFDRTTREQQYDTAGALRLTKSQTFDPFDRTTTQTTAITGKPTKNLRFTYLGTTEQVAVEEEKNNLGAWEVAKTYAHGPEGENLELKHTPVNETTNKIQYYGTNPHGDVETLTSADGTTASTYRYTAYGRPDKKGTTGEDAFATGGTEADRLEADTEVVNPYRFSGKRIHGGTGTYDGGFRDYNPGINRFLTRDFYNNALSDLALGTDPWGTNRYAYAGGNPIGMIDLDGHRPIDINGNERPDLDTRITQKPEGVADDEHTRGAFYGNGTAEASSTCAKYPSSPGCALKVPYDRADRPVIFTPEEQALNRELGLALCSWIPIAGVACDAYDAQRTYEEDGLISWQMAAAVVGFLPLGDIAKLPKQANKVGGAWMDAVRAAGREGEDAAGIVKNTRRIPSATGKKPYRIPDELNSEVIGEVKNVKHLEFRSQLRDDLAYAETNGLQFNLYVRQSTTFSGPLQEMIDAGRINIVRNLGP